MKTENKKFNGGFTLTEIMVVVAIIGLLAVISVPSYGNARDRSHASSCVNNLRQIDGARTQYALEYSAAATDITDLVPEYIKHAPICPTGGIYGTGGLNGDATCSIGGTHAY